MICDLDKRFRDWAISELESSLTEARQEKCRAILDERMSYMSIVLEDIYNPQNSNAVLRTADCFGVQNVHIVETMNVHEERNLVSKGSEKWLSLHRYNTPDIDNSLVCIKRLKEQGIRIVSAMPHKEGVDIRDFDVKKGPFAIVLGNELYGVSMEMEEFSDEYINIPMYGFTESLNLSVAGALCMHELRNKICREVPDWPLTEDERKNVHLEWIVNSLPSGKAMLKRMEQDYFQKVEK